MPIPYDLPLTDDGDLKWNAPLVNDPWSVSQKIVQAVSWFIGTWTLDRFVGLDWFTLLETKLSDADIEVVRERIRQIAKNIRGVYEVTEVLADMDDQFKLRFAVEFIADDEDRTSVVLATPGYEETNWQPTALVIEINLRPSYA